MIESLFKSIRNCNKDDSRDLSNEATIDTLSTSLMTRNNEKTTIKSEIIEHPSENHSKKIIFTDLLSNSGKDLNVYKRFKQSSEDNPNSFTKAKHCLQKIQKLFNIF